MGPVGSSMDKSVSPSGGTTFCTMTCRFWPPMGDAYLLASTRPPMINGVGPSMVRRRLIGPASKQMKGRVPLLSSKRPRAYALPLELVPTFCRRTRQGCSRSLPSLTSLIMKAPSLDALEDKVLMGTNYFKMAA